MQAVHVRRGAKLRRELRAQIGDNVRKDETNPYAQLELIAPVRAGEQLFVDYGPSYPYSAHRFARYVGAGQPQLVGDTVSAAQAARLEQIQQTGQRMQAWSDKHLKAR